MSHRRDPIGPFRGISKSALDFLRQLAVHNDREWFRAHEERYRNEVEGPTAALVVALGEAVRAFAPSAVAEPRVGGSLFRIQRDMRFAKGAPYKTHVGLRIRHRSAAHGSRCEGPVMYVQYSSDQLLLGVGEKEFDSATRSRWLQLLGRDPSAVLSAATFAERNNHDMVGQLLKRAPMYHADTRIAVLARRKGLFVQRVGPLPRSVHGQSFVDHCADFFSAYGDLFEALGGLHETPGRA